MRAQVLSFTLFICTLNHMEQHASADTPYASAVVSYTAGTGAAAGFTTPASALGPPERFTGEGAFPACVTPFSPAYRPNEVVSLGVSGALVLAFDHDVIDDARNPFGVDLLVFGNAFFSDAQAGMGMVAGLASEGGAIDVSLDGITWTSVPLLAADGLFPTLGYSDVAPYATQPGTLESNFLRPVDPSRSMKDLVGLDYESLVTLYDGSGGGAGIDLGALGLSRIRFVRISNSVVGSSPEVDAIADVAPVTPPSDFDGDGMVGAADLAQLLGAWATTNAQIDLDGDGVVNASDLALLLAAWGSAGTT